MEFYYVFIYPFLMNIYFNCKKYFKDKSNYLLSKQDNIMIQTSTQSNFIQNQLNADFLSCPERDSHTGKKNNETIKINNNEKKYYLFCYGSNSSEQIQQRLDLNDKLTSERAYIKDHIRIFAGKSERWNGGIASIYPKMDSEVYGILVKLTLEEIEKMDKFEGGYERKIMNVIKQLENELEEIIESFVYVKKNQIFEYLPSNQYLFAIRKMLDERKMEGKNKENIIIYGLNDNEIKKIGIWDKKYGILLNN